MVNDAATRLYNDNLYEKDFHAAIRNFRRQSELAVQDSTYKPRKIHIPIRQDYNDEKKIFPTTNQILKLGESAVDLAEKFLKKNQI